MSCEDGAHLVGGSAPSMSGRIRAASVDRQPVFKSVEIGWENVVDGISINGFLANAKPFAYANANGGSIINYPKRHRESGPISNAMAESAVEQILSHRMCKRQLMRWSSQGVHLLAQVRCAVVKADLAGRLTAAFRLRVAENPS